MRVWAEPNPNGAKIGIDAGAATAEEAAMHVIDLDPGDGALARDAGSRD